MARLRLDGQPTTEEIRLADRWWRRAVGLLATTQLERPSGLWLAPCAAIHTLGMRLTIDIVFVGRDGVVLKVVPRLRPGRMASCRGAHAVLELREGLAQTLGLHPGRHVSLQAAGAFKEL
nr:DUF192 domain-containing protein [Ideonella oryzae]